MYDENDAEDARLIARGEFERLLAKYLPAIRQRCRARLGADAEDATQDVLLHLFRDLRSGRRYRHPFRVIVHMRTTWTIREYLQSQGRRPPYVPIDRLDLPGSRGIEVDDHRYLRQVLDQLPPGERRAVELVWICGMGIDEAAEMCDMTRNALDQALHRARRRLRGIIDDG